MIYRTVKINSKESLGYIYNQPTTIDEAWEIIKKERELRQLHGGFKVGEKWYQSDFNSRIKYLGLFLYGSNLPNNIDWKTFDNTFQRLSPVLVQQIFQSVAVHDNSVFKIAEQIKSQLTQENLSTFDVKSGWPTAYWEVLSP